MFSFTFLYFDVDFCLFCFVCLFLWLVVCFVACWYGVCLLVLVRSLSIFKLFFMLVMFCFCIFCSWLCCCFIVVFECPRGETGWRFTAAGHALKICGSHGFGGEHLLVISRAAKSILHICLGIDL